MIMNDIKLWLFAIAFFLQSILNAQINEENKFISIVLGCSGGITENNLSSYLLANFDSDDFICLDAGSLYNGISKAYKMGSFDGIEIPDSIKTKAEAWILRNFIKAYLISHPHLDHTAGLIISSPIDSNKEIYGLDFTIESLKKNTFNWDVWANFTNEGEGFHLDKYNFVKLEEKKSTKIANTEFTVEAFELSHLKPVKSTAFLVQSGDYYLLYCGDMGADETEKTNNLNALWERIAPLIVEEKLRAIFIETSFPSDYPDSLLFGHLTPKLLMKELTNLAKKVDKENYQTALKELKIVITHIKPSIEKGINNRQIIIEEFEKISNLGARIIIPEQGMLLEL